MFLISYVNCNFLFFHELEKMWTISYKHASADLGVKAATAAAAGSWQQWPTKQPDHNCAAQNNAVQSSEARNKAIQNSAARNKAARYSTVNSFPHEIVDWSRGVFILFLFILFNIAFLDFFHSIDFINFSHLRLFHGAFIFSHSSF